MHSEDVLLGQEVGLIWPWPDCIRKYTDIYRLLLSKDVKGILEYKTQQTL